MEEQKKMKWEDDGWFSKTAQQDEEARTGGMHPSMEKKGLEEVTIIRDDVFGERERGGHPGYETVKVNEVQMFLLDKFRDAAYHGHLHRTYSNYVREFKRTGVFDKKVSGAFEKFSPQVEQAGHWSEQVKLFEDEIKPYIGKISMG